MRELGKKISIDRVRAMVFHATFNGVTSHNVIHHFEMKKIFGGEAKQNPRDST
jgi:hypothetical protein